METLRGSKSNGARKLRGVVGALLLVSASLLTGCAGGANLSSMGASRFESGPTPDSSADFAQLPSGGFGGSESQGIVATASSSGTSSFEGSSFAGDVGFTSAGFTSDWENSFATPTNKVAVVTKQKGHSPSEVPPASSFGLLPVDSPDVSALVTKQFLQALSCVDRISRPLAKETRPEEGQRN